MEIQQINDEIMETWKAHLGVMTLQVARKLCRRRHFRKFRVRPRDIMDWCVRVFPENEVSH